MEMPDFYIKEILRFNSVTDLLENLYLNSLIEAYPKVLNIPNIIEFDENHIRDEFQKVICFDSGELSNWLNNNTITLTVENQIFTKDNERKRTDIAFIIPRLKFIIECKKVKSASKLQYIDSGILRFINDVYTNENDRYAGMCSFIFQNNVNELINGIKEKVKKCNLIKLDDDIICKFQYSFRSKHNKMDIADIQIYHLFFDMKNK